MFVGGLVLAWILHYKNKRVLLYQRLTLRLFAKLGVGLLDLHGARGVHGQHHELRAQVHHAGAAEAPRAQLDGHL